MSDTDTLTDLFEAARDIDLDDEEDWELLVREAELHELVSQHETLTRFVDAIEDEMGFRADREQKVAAGTDQDRAYAAEHGDEY